MTAATVRNADEQWAIRITLGDYRRLRRFRDAYDSAEEIRDSAARSLANVVVDNGPHLDLATVHYRAARALFDEVKRRAAIGTDWDAKTAIQRFWAMAPIRKAVTQ